MADTAVARPTSQGYRFLDSSQIGTLRSQTNQYQIIVRQNPKRGKVFHAKDRDRRPLDPPPFVQIVAEKPTNHTIFEEDDQCGSHRYLHNPYLFMYAALVYVNEIDGQETIRSATTGNMVSSLHRLKDTNDVDGGFFVFPDISVMIEGEFVLRFYLYELVDSRVKFISAQHSAPFTVYPAKKFPGMAETTFLSRFFSDQGVRIRTRKDHRLKFTRRICSVSAHTEENGLVTEVSHAGSDTQGESSPETSPKRPWITSGMSETPHLKSMPGRQSSSHIPSLGGTPLAVSPPDYPRKRLMLDTEISSRIPSPREELSNSHTATLPACPSALYTPLPMVAGQWEHSRRHSEGVGQHHRRHHAHSALSARKPSATDRSQWVISSPLVPSSRARLNSCSTMTDGNSVGLVPFLPRSHPDNPMAVYYDSVPNLGPIDQKRSSSSSRLLSHDFGNSFGSYLRRHAIPIVSKPVYGLTKTHPLVRGNSDLVPASTSGYLPPNNLAQLTPPTLVNRHCTTAPTTDP
ncbi:hypothetical protein IWQ61_001563 [Dispira simplex]|nr:hypothetical protein IWQ61_001563 [Dispira simplex]